METDSQDPIESRKPKWRSDAFYKGRTGRGRGEAGGNAFLEWLKLSWKI